ncbi:MAG: bifunctional glycoside hydrolase 114/ polysaccharide deacetylase family protein [Planctomycetota bacterium]
MNIRGRAALLLALGTPLAAFGEPVPGSGTAFFYGAPLPAAALAFYERVVVEPDATSPEEVAALRRGGTEVLAYLSLGEIARTSSRYPRVEREWILGNNPDWDSDILDLSHAGWRALAVEQAQSLHARGFDGLFLDTLDSYPRVSEGAAREQQRLALASLISALHESCPGKVLLLNRGFDVLPEVAEYVAGVVVESLFQTSNSAGTRFTAVPESDRTWLLDRMRAVQDRYSLPITVIDYVAPNDPDLARATARRIREQGFVPWVATPALDAMGVGNVEVVPRRVLALYSSRSGSLAAADAHTGLAPCLEYAGFAVDYLDVNGSLPTYSLRGRYAGVVTWLQANDVADSARYSAWIRRHLDDGLRFAIFGHPGFVLDSSLLTYLGLEAATESLPKPVHLVLDRAIAGFEADPLPRSRGLTPIRLQSGDAIVSVVGADGQRVDGVFVAPWGGMALVPFLLHTQLDESRRWIIDPFRFLANALRLPPIPAPDTTTENGSRLFFAHIDGDGAPSRAEWANGPYAAEVIQSEVLEVYRVPTAVSFVEGEIGASGIYPETSAALETVARRIFALPHVELATHTYSHPFDWESAVAEPQNAAYRLPIRGYELCLDREIVGSASYLERFAPPGKRVGIVLWSGDALPTVGALATAERADLINMNGGTTRICRSHPSLLNVSPLLRPVGDYLQVYAPITNENVFTNLWQGPFYGFRSVIESFEMTDRPRRLKPIDIYYHFYSGSKQSSLLALREVYDWALARETLPVFPSEFIRLALDFDRVTLARDLDDHWWIRGLGDLRTLRVPESAGFPDVNTCPLVVGVREHEDARYISFAPPTPGTCVRLALVPNPVPAPMIERTNARVRAWAREGCGFRLRLYGHVHTELRIVGVETGSQLFWDGTPFSAECEGDTWTVYLPEGDSGEVVLRAP